MATKKAGGSSRNGRDSAGRRLGVKKYGHRQPISLIRITKIFSKNGKLIAQAELKKEKVPIKKIKKVELKTKESIKKPEFKAKKSSPVKKKAMSKKKPLTTKKK